MPVGLPRVNNWLQQPHVSRIKNSKSMFIVVTVAAMLVAATALATESVFAPKKRKYNQVSHKQTLVATEKPNP